MTTSRRVDSLAARIVEQLRARGETIATCESLTAGLCAAALADVPGASAVLRGGLIVYATDLKALLAGVDEELLRIDGAVSPRVAAALAEGASRRCGATWGVGLTGVAGPDPQDGHPVGEVWIGVARSGRPADVCKMTAPRELSRPSIRQQAVEEALCFVLSVLACPVPAPMLSGEQIPEGRRLLH